ncbi:hypothetical protein, partial [Prosthecobacter sp.]|uniref:hypothetical protein n=1 Tax=Prosthecobacter sp. TaxID=1965333 RepID=UPI0024875C8C
MSDEIEVETRHIASDDGFCFRMCLTQEAVQVERIESLHVGTRIRVRVNHAVLQKLRKPAETTTKPSFWDWYKLDHPVVHRVTGGYLRPQKSTIDLSKWQIAPSEVPMTIHWSYNYNSPALTCNGIFVTSAASVPEILPSHCGLKDWGGKYRVRTPRLHITDPDGHLALGLTRKEVVTEEYGFENSLVSNIMSSFFALLLVKFPESFDAKTILNLVKLSPFAKD